MTHAVAVGHWPLSHLLQLGVVVCLPGEDRWLPEPLALGGVSCPLWTVVGHLLHPHPRGRQGGREEGGGRGEGGGGGEGGRERCKKLESTMQSYISMTSHLPK